MFKETNTLDQIKVVFYIIGEERAHPVWEGAPQYSSVPTSENKQIVLSLKQTHCSCGVRDSA